MIFHSSLEIFSALWVSARSSAFLEHIFMWFHNIYSTLFSISSLILIVGNHFSVLAITWCRADLSTLTSETMTHFYLLRGQLRYSWQVF